MADRITRANGVFRMLYPMINPDSTIHTSIKLLLYKMCIRPVLLYAASVWAPAAPSYRTKLQVMQNKCLRTIFNLPRETRISILHIRAAIEYIDKVMDKLITDSYIFEHSNPLINKLSKYSIVDLPFKIRCRLPKHFTPKLHPP